MLHAGRKPVQRMTASNGSSRPLGHVTPLLGETLEGANALEDAPLARFFDWGQHHHVPEAPGRRPLASGPPGLVPLRGPLEEHAAVHIVGQEARLLECRPGRLRDSGNLGEDLRPGVFPADHQHPPAPVGLRRAVMGEWACSPRNRSRPG